MCTAGKAARRQGFLALCTLLTLAAAAPATAEDSGFSLGGSFDAALRPYFAPEPQAAPSIPLMRRRYGAGFARPSLQPGTGDPALGDPAVGDRDNGDAGLAGDVTFRQPGEDAASAGLSVTANGVYLDPNQWFVGLGVGLNGFAVGGSYSVSGNLDARDTLGHGVSYSRGAWSFGLNYQNQDSPVTQDQDREDSNRLGAGVVYSLGPRLSASASAMAAYSGSAEESDSEIDDLTGVLGFSFQF